MRGGLRLLLFLLAGLSIISLARAGDLRCSLKLRDGSVVNGSMPDGELPVVAETVGAIKVPLSRIASVKFGGDGKPDTLLFKNRDKLQGDVQLAKITIETLFGRVSVAKGVLVEMQVKATGEENAQALEWEILPFPRDSDWPGDRGTPAEVQDDGSIVLHGRPVLSKQTFSLPLTIDCDVFCPEPTEDDGGFTVGCFFPEQPTDMNDREVVTFHYGYRNHGTPGMVLCSRNHGSPRGQVVWSEHAVPYTAGKTIHLRLELTAAGSKLTAGEESFDISEVVVPYKQFRIRLNGWRTTDPWRVSNLSVR